MTANGRKRAASLDRVPPQDIDSERGVLGSILLNPSVCDEVILAVKTDDFYLPAHQVLFRILTQMWDKGRRIDDTLLVAELKKRDALEDVGGQSYLMEIAESVPTAANAVWYAKIVRDKATLRSLIHVGTEMVRDGYDESGECRDKIVRAEQRLMAVLENQGARELQQFEDVLHEAYDGITKRSENKRAKGISTGFPELDDLCRLRDSELIIVAARPSMGKTAFATTIAEYLLLQEEKRVLFASLEMSRLALVDRMLLSLARVDSRRANNGLLDQKDRREIVAAVARWGQARNRFLVDDEAGRTISEIAAQARHTKRKGGLDLLIIDYLQRIHAENPREVREQQVAQMARRLKDLAQEIATPVLCLAQLNRQADLPQAPAGRATEKTPDRRHRPKLSHLRESGSIEQDADIVLLIHREDYFREDQKAHDGDAEIIVAKNRNGPTGTVNLEWAPVWTRFTSKKLF
ncbi:MAG TPA: replicative DNA helicase [Pirellulales bacterium]|nr:replicative DNA helicase [Pirellulales bacterium]